MKKHLIKEKILLINPPNSLPKGSPFTINIFQPLGLAYIASCLEKNNYPVEIFDALALGFDQKRDRGNKTIIGLSYQKINQKINRYKPDIIGITIPFSLQADEAHYLAKHIKKYHPNIIVIAGGSHATIQPNDLLNDPSFDFIVKGEGEDTLINLLSTIHSPSKLKQVKNISYRDKKGKVIHNPRGNPLLNLNSYPLPARHLLPMDIYFDIAKTGRVVEGLLEFGKRRTSIFTSRGCPYNCVFCSVHLTMSKIWRPRSPENVLSELKECVEKYDIKYFDILDDNLTLDPNRAKEICKLIIKNKLNIKWSTPNGIRADKLDDELVILMKQSGCIQVKVAPESGSQKVLTNIIKKHLDLKLVKRAVKLCAKHKLSIEAFFVIGFPQETKKDILKTISFAKELIKLGCDYCYFFIATPYFGTELYESAVRNGNLSEANYNLKEVLTTGSNPMITSPNFTPQELIQLHEMAAKINPPITKIRLMAGLRMILIDPIRIFKYAINYLSH